LGQRVTFRIADDRCSSRNCDTRLSPLRQSVLPEWVELGPNEMRFNLIGRRFVRLNADHDG
jgi:hypothetical protein